MRKLLPLVALFLSACSSPGELVRRHEPMTTVGLTDVTVPGTYGLFIAGDDEPLLRYPLRRGDKVGFETASTPAADQLQIQWLYGVAGTARGRLDVRQTYEWRRLPDQN